MAGLALLAVVSCGRPDQALAPFERVFLVTLDTLRADHLGSHGYPRGTSPFLDELAEEGVQFLNAQAAMPTTAPSHASLLTSLYPFEHGLLKNGEALDPSFLTVTNLLGRAGFQTAAFVAVRFLRQGLGHGFETFDVELSEGRNYRVAGETVDAALRWASDKSPEDRFFVWVHLFDPHEHWEKTPPPPGYLERLEPRTPEDRRTLLDLLGGLHDLRPGQLRADNPLVRRILRYDAQILHADQELRRLYQALGAQGLTEDSLWIVTSDHGEGLGNHRYILHGRYLYQEHLHVPLFFHSPRPGFPRRRVDTLVEHVDLLPTLADLMALPLEPPGYALRGTSLRPLLTGSSPAASPRYAFAQRRPKDRDRPDFEDGDLMAIRDPRFKYVHRSVGRSEFYDLEEDPLEKDNRIDRPSEAARRLREHLERQVAPRFHEPLVPRRPFELDPETRRELEALGYVK